MWGAATSSYQIEGGNTAADWARWESEGRVPEAAGRAAGSWERYRDDVDLAVEIGLGVYRISTEWSRIEPEQGRFDADAIAHYVEWLRYARSRGLKTMLVLWHFTNPAWVTEAGGWENAATPERFEAFVRRVVPDLAESVDFWATINEADTYVRHGWLTGEWPPGKHVSWLDGWRVYGTLAEGHVRARDAIRELLGENVEVGLTHVVPWCHPADGWGVLAGANVGFWNWLTTFAFLDRLRGRMDWLGVQYYYDSPCRIVGYDMEDATPPRTDLGWRIAPEGLYRVVKLCWERYRVPIIVTENGLADAADAQRPRFILDHLAWLHRAIEEGCDVRGYLHWSLIDNFEWAHGFGPRFGLAEVDYDTLQRRLRPSARLYAEIAAANALPEGLRPDLRYREGQGSLGPR